MKLYKLASNDWGEDKVGNFNRKTMSSMSSMYLTVYKNESKSKKASKHSDAPDKIETYIS